MREATDIHPKVAASAAGAALASIIVWVFKFIGVEIPETIAANIIIVGTFAAGYMTPE